MDRLTRLFPLLAIAAGVLAYAAPGVFAPYEPAIVPLLIVIMFAMGLTLTVGDFRRVARQPAAVGLGVLLQYTVMPAAALVVGYVLEERLSDARTSKEFDVWRWPDVEQHDRKDGFWKLLYLVLKEKFELDGFSPPGEPHGRWAEER